MTQHEQGRWLELSTRVDPEAVEAVAEVFARHGYNQGVVIEEDVAPGPGGEGTVVVAGRPIAVRTYLPLGPRASAEREAIEQALWHLGQMRPIEPLQVVEREEEEWADAWKQYYQVHRIGRRCVIKPSWQEYQPRPGDLIIEMDPGMAFGTGLHPTTSMCLRALEQFLKPGARVLDIGTGSGILAIAAARLGAASVWAVDVDPVAVGVARANVERNRVNELVQVEEGSLGDGPPEQPAADLVVANIVARVIRALAPRFFAALRAGGWLVAGGIIADQAQAVFRDLGAAGLSVQAIMYQGDWVTVVARRD